MLNNTIKRAVGALTLAVMAASLAGCVCGPFGHRCHGGYGGGYRGGYYGGGGGYYNHP